MVHNNSLLLFHGTQQLFRKKTHQIVMALALSFKNLAQIHYKFITNIFLTTLLSIHQKLTSIHQLQLLFTKQENFSSL